METDEETAKLLASLKNGCKQSTGAQAQPLEFAAPPTTIAPTNLLSQPMRPTGSSDPATAFCPPGHSMFPGMAMPAPHMRAGGGWMLVPVIYLVGPACSFPVMQANQTALSARFQGYPANMLRVHPPTPAPEAAPHFPLLSAGAPPPPEDSGSPVPTSSRNANQQTGRATPPAMNDPEDQEEEDSHVSAMSHHDEPKAPLAPQVEAEKSARNIPPQRGIQKKKTSRNGKSLTPGHCVTCGATASLLWRKGPEGKGTLCNACGLSWRRKQNKEG